MNTDFDHSAYQIEYFANLRNPFIARFTKTHPSVGASYVSLLFKLIHTVAMNTYKPAGAFLAGGTWVHYDEEITSCCSGYMRYINWGWKDPLFRGFHHHCLTINHIERKHQLKTGHLRKELVRIRDCAQCITARILLTGESDWITTSQDLKGSTRSWVVSDLMSPTEHVVQKSKVACDLHNARGSYGKTESLQNHVQDLSISIWKSLSASD